MLVVWGLFWASITVLGGISPRNGFTLLSKQENCNVGSCLKFCETETTPSTTTQVKTKFSTKWISSTITKLVNKTNLVTATTLHTSVVTSTRILDYNATTSCPSVPSLVKRDTRDLTTTTGTTVLSSSMIMPTTVSQSQYIANMSTTRALAPTTIAMTTNISEYVNTPNMVTTDFNPFVWISIHPELTGILILVCNHNLGCVISRNYHPLLADDANGSSTGFCRAALPKVLLP